MAREPGSNLPYDRGELVFEVILRSVRDGGSDPCSAIGTDNLPSRGQENAVTGFGDEEGETPVADRVGRQVADDERCWLQMSVNGVDLGVQLGKNECGEPGLKLRQVLLRFYNKGSGTTERLLDLENEGELLRSDT